MPKLTPAAIKRAMRGVRGWKLRGRTITRTFVFKDFPAAIKFVNAVARAAEKADHHPDIDIRWNKVTMTLSTHSAGGLTQQDFNMARKIDQLA